jgi:hypothetical protein
MWRFIAFISFLQSYNLLSTYNKLQYQYFSVKMYCGFDFLQKHVILRFQISVTAFFITTIYFKYSYSITIITIVCTVP